MTDAVLDRVVFQVAGDLTPLRGAYVKAEADAAVAGARTGKAFAEAQGAVIKASGAASPFFSASAGGSAHILAMRRALDDMAAASNRVPAAAGSAGRALRELGEHARNTHTPLMTMGRHLFAAGHEMSEGNFSRAAYTLTQMSTHMFRLSAATVGLGVAIASIPIGLGAAIVSFDRLMSHASIALAASGYAAGYSLEGLRTIAQQGQGPGFSEREAFHGAEALASRGNISRGLLPSALAAGEGFQRATGLDSGEAFKKFEEILADPAKGAAALNEQFKLLSVEQQRQIEDLQQSGNLYGAQKMLIEAVHDRMGHLRDQTWSLGQAFEGVTTFFSNFWHHTGEMFAGPPRSERLADLQAAFYKLRDAPPPMPNTPAAFLREQQLTGLTSEILHIQQAQRAERTLGQGTEANRAVGLGMADADKQAGAFNEHLRELQNQLNRDAYAARMAKESHSKFADVLEDQRKATELALHNQISPAAEAKLRADEERRIASASPRSQAAVQAQVNAARIRRQALSDPQSSLDAEELAKAALSTAGVAQSAQSQETIRVTREEAQAQTQLAAAYMESGEAVARTKATNEAHAAFMRGAITDEKAYRDAILARAHAQAAAATASQFDRARDQVAGLLGVANAGGMPASVAAAKRHAEAIAATQGEFDTARTEPERKAAQARLDALEKEYAARDRLNVLINSNARDFGMDQQIAQQQLVVDLIGKTEQAQYAAIRALQTKQDMESAGWSPEMEGYDAEYQKIMRNKEAMEQLNQTQQRQNAIAEGTSSAVVGALDAIANRTGSLGHILLNFGAQIAQLIFKLVVLNKIANAITGAISGKPGTLPTSSLGQIGSAFMSMFEHGGAWGGGGVRFAAQGMVLSGPTMFASSSGPVMGGEKGLDREALIPLFRAPDGNLGVKARISGASTGGPVTHVYQTVNIHPDVPSVFAGMMAREMPKIKQQAVAGVSEAWRRGARIMGPGS